MQRQRSKHIQTFKLKLKPVEVPRQEKPHILTIPINSLTVLLHTSKAAIHLLPLESWLKFTIRLCKVQQQAAKSRKQAIVPLMHLLNHQISIDTNLYKAN
jgi:hypothetical protein